jgi:chemotaxis protein MotB
LNSFEGKGLDRGTKNGKVYVPWKINYCSILVVGGSGKESSGRTGESIGRQPDISVLIEGHTDDRFSASGPIADNWDLSTKRNRDS